MVLLRILLLFVFVLGTPSLASDCDEFVPAFSNVQEWVDAMESVLMQRNYEWFDPDTGGKTVIPMQEACRRFKTLASEVWQNRQQTFENYRKQKHGSPDSYDYQEWQTDKKNSDVYFSKVIPSTLKLLDAVSLVKKRFNTAIDQLERNSRNSKYTEDLEDLRKIVSALKIHQTSELPLDGVMLKNMAIFDWISEEVFVTEGLIEDQQSGGNLEYVLMHEIGHASGAIDGYWGEVGANAFAIIALSAIDLEVDVDALQHSALGRNEKIPDLYTECREPRGPEALLQILRGPAK